MGILDDIYQKTLGRSADASGAAYWQGQLDSGKTADQVRAAMYDSAEAKDYRYNTGASRAAEQNGKSTVSTIANPTDNQSRIENMYRTQLGRESDAAGMAYWMDMANTQGIDAVDKAFDATKEVQGYASYTPKTTPKTPEAPSMSWQDSPYTAQMRDVNAATDTIQGQLDTLLSKENPLMQRAYYKGKDYANSRGLLNSSVGSEAAQAAMMDVALPIAQGDSQTYYDQGIKNQGYINQYNLNDRQYLQGAEQNALQRQHETATNNQNNAIDREIEATKQDAGLYAQFLKGVGDINASNMEQGEKDSAVQSLWTQYTAGSQIANSLRYISVNPDGSVVRNTPTGQVVDTTQSPVAATNANTTAKIYGQGIYTSGYTRDSNGNLVDKDGKPQPEAGYTLTNGEWEAPYVDNGGK